MRIVDNYESKIWLGLRVGYTDSYFNKADIARVISEWCNEKKQCVTITPTEFIYVDGKEPGVIIGFINYARFPQSEVEIRNRTRELATILMKKFKQYRVSCTFYPSHAGGSMMLENTKIK